MSFLIAALLLAAEPAAAPTVPPAATPPKSTTAPAAKPKKEKKICKPDPIETGSHMSRRICLTANEWELKKQGVNFGAKSVSTSMPNNE